ncbi:hypothetical protein Gotur_020574 [Gossypium turneri]
MFGDCVIKEAQLREDDPPDDGGEDVTMKEAFGRSMSSKECLVGSTGRKHNGRMVQEDEDIVLIKGDVQKDWINELMEIDSEYLLAKFKSETNFTKVALMENVLYTRPQWGPRLLVDLDPNPYGIEDQAGLSRVALELNKSMIKNRSRTMETPNVTMEADGRMLAC